LKGSNKKKQKAKPLQRKSNQRVDKNIINRWVWGSLAVVFITTLIIYFRAITFDLLYSWDDKYYITTNDHIRNLQWANIKLFFTNFYIGNYQPLTMLFYAFDYKIGSAQASIFHFNNILLHLLNTYLVFVLIRRISPKNAVVALITAAFFAVHPMHVESVAWVAERKDVLYSFFFLLSLIMYTNYLKSSKKKFLIYTAVFFMLSCLSKSAAVVLPLVMLLFDYYANRNYNWKTIAEKIPFFMISLIIGIVAIYSQKTTGAIQDQAPNMTKIEQISIVSYSFVSYLFKAIIPIHLSAIYNYPIELGSTLPLKYYLSILLVALLLFFVWYSRKWGKEIVFGFLFFLITIILVLQFIPIGAATMADRYTYMPYIGIFFIAGKLFERFSNKVNSKKNYSKYILIVFALGFITFSTITYGRVKVWKDEGSLFSDAIEKDSNSAIAYLIRGNYYYSYFANEKYVNDNKNRELYINSAINDYGNSIKYEINVKSRWRAYYNMGVAKSTLGNYVGAIKDLNKALEYEVDLENKVNINYSLAVAKSSLGDFVGAIHDYDKTIAIDSSYGKSYINRGTCNMTYYVKTLYVNDNTAKETYIKTAILDFETALKCKLITEDKAKAYCNLGDAKVRLGNFSDAINDFDKGIQIDPNTAGANAYSTRAFAKLQLKNYPGAFEDYNMAIKLNPQDANSIKNRDIVKSIIEKKGN